MRGVHLFFEDKRCWIQGFYGFLCSLVKGKNADCYVVAGLVCKVKMIRDLFRSIFVIFSNFTEIFEKGVYKFPACFSLVDLLAKCTG